MPAEERPGLRCSPRPRPARAVRRPGISYSSLSESKPSLLQVLAPPRLCNLDSCPSLLSPTKLHLGDRRPPLSLLLSQARRPMRTSCLGLQFMAFTLRSCTHSLYLPVHLLQVVHARQPIVTRSRILNEVVSKESCQLVANIMTISTFLAI